MIIILVTLFLAIAFWSFYLTDNHPQAQYFYFGFGIILLIIVAFRGEGVDKDYLNYKDEFLSNSEIPFIIEPSFIFLKWIVRTYLNSNIFIFFFAYAILGIGLKMYAIKQLSKHLLASLLIYMSYSFILHDMTQIRASVAVGFFLLSIKPLQERNGIKFIVFSSLAIAFHFSAAILPLVWFLNPNKINVKTYLIAIVASYILSAYSSTIVSKLFDYAPEGPLQLKLLAYEDDNSGVLNVYNVWQLMRCALSVLFLLKIDFLKRQSEYAVLLVKIYVISACSFVILSNNPALAGRTSDMFSIVDIVIVPCLITLVTPKIASKLIVIFIGFSYLILNLFYNKIIS